MTATFFNRGVMVIAAAAALAGCAGRSAPVSLAETLAASSQTSTFSSLATKAGLSDTLRTGGPFTVFAPSNEAFSKVPAKTMDALAADPVKLKAVLAYHVINGRVMASEVRNATVTTLQGASIALSKAGDFVTIEEAMVQQSDIPATNGIVHIVDSVVMPPAR